MFKPVSSNVPIKVWMKISSGLMRKVASELSQVWMVNIFECEVKWLISTEWSKRGFGCSFEQYKFSRAFTCKACVHNLEYTCQVIFEWSLSVVSYVRKLNKKFQGSLCKARVHSIETTFDRTDSHSRVLTCLNTKTTNQLIGSCIRRLQSWQTNCWHTRTLLCRLSRGERGPK